MAGKYSRFTVYGYILTQSVNNYGMVTYCLGSARQKRAYFAASDAVVLDNVEVLFCASIDGKNYFAYGDVPFSSFTVSEYLKYRRALCSADVDEGDIRAFGISPDKRLCSLVPAEMRIVAFLEKTCGKTDRAVVVNLDGTKYTRRNAAALNRLLARVKDAYVCVTDRKFVRKAPVEHRELSFGKPSFCGKPVFYYAKILARKINAKRISVM